MTEVWIDGEPEPPKRPRLRLLAAVAGAVVVLAAVGATGGWLLASANKENHASGGGSATPSVGDLSPSSTGATPSPTEPATPTAAEFPLPDVTGVDFLDARRQLRELKLGVQVDFHGAGDGHSVERTTPRAGEIVHAGVTVKLQVPGDPPTVQVPSLVGMGCADAGRDAADRGLVPQYKPKKAGRVVEQDPRPYEEARWNDRIKLVCEGGATAY